MNDTQNDGFCRGFSLWLRTGRRPIALGPDGLELKFNPWHDPKNGRFTFANAGHRQGTDRIDRSTGSTVPSGAAARRAPGLGKDVTLRRSVLAKAHAQGATLQASERSSLPRNGYLAAPPTRPSQRSSGHQANPVSEFAGGFGEGLYGVAEESVAGVYAALTTNPVTTIGAAGRDIAGMIDAAIAAEDTPARVQISRTAAAIAKASPRDIGRATGSLAGNVALAVGPGAAVAKVAALRRLRLARPRRTFKPPQIGWVKENLGPDKDWVRYNDAAPGARAGQAPTLMRTMP